MTYDDFRINEEDRMPNRSYPRGFQPKHFISAHAAIQTLPLQKPSLTEPSSVIVLIRHVNGWRICVAITPLAGINFLWLRPAH